MRTYARRWSLPSVKPHDFRHFVGTKLAKRDLHLTQKALGQKHLETTVQHDGLTNGWY
jgi:integrase